MSGYREFCRQLMDAFMEKDPSLHSKWEVRYMPGYRAIKSWYWTHRLYQKGKFGLARVISLRTQRRTGIDIHPGATIGKRLFIDHGVGVVIGETCIIGDDVSIYQGVTLGGTGKEKGKRHPNVEDGVFIGAGAKVLGNITLGAYSKIGAGAIVVRDVPAHTTMVSPPAYPVTEKNHKLSHLCHRGDPRWHPDGMEVPASSLVLPIVHICSNEE